MKLSSKLIQRLRRAVNRQRLVETAVQLIAVPSRTGEGGAVADRLAGLLAADGFTVDRPIAGHAPAPAVVVRWDSGRPARTLQFNGHLDTVHLPFVPPQVNKKQITGSGASDMKAGVAAAVEALRVLRETAVLPAGSILFTAHDLHEAPWGWGQQLDGLIRTGFVGDGVLLPEPLCNCLPLVGRGAAVWKITIRRQGTPVHEVMRPPDEPSVIAAGAELAGKLTRLNQRLAAGKNPFQVAGNDSVFVGQIHSGEIYNQYPQICTLEGTRRWLPGKSRVKIERDFRALAARVAETTRTEIEVDYHLIRDGFLLDKKGSLVESFQEGYAALSGRPLPTGPKPFCDDGNSFWSDANVPAITHGPQAGGQHTVNEWVSIDDLVRVAQLYALTAVAFCDG